MSQDIKYRYALTDAKKLIDIEKASNLDRKDYYCVSCGGVLRPVLPKSGRRKHFRHLNEENCSFETYLHRLGKQVFRESYQECLERGVAYKVEYLVPQKCRGCETFDPCNFAPEESQYDLTQKFTHIKEEVPDDGFIPDLLLETSGGEKVYIEIAVTHTCATNKIHSGNRIIEISIQSEDDLSLIKSNNIPTSDKRVSLYNFNPPPNLLFPPKVCRKQIHYFVLWSSGKSIIYTDTPIKYERDLKDSRIKYILRVAGDGILDYLKGLEEAYDADQVVKSCFLCRYHALARGERQRENGNAIFCKFLKEGFSSNHAAECEFYRIDKEVFFYNRMRKL